VFHQVSVAFPVDPPFIIELSFLGISEFDGNIYCGRELSLCNLVLLTSLGSSCLLDICLTGSDHKFS
jgi:hypothetical protein